MHDLNSEILMDARGEFCWMRARAWAACRQAARLLIFRARWLLNRVPERILGLEKPGRAPPGAQKKSMSQIRGKVQ